MKLSVMELLRLLMIVNNWPARNVGTMAMMIRLGDILELTADEKEQIGFREAIVNGQASYTWNPNAPELEREFTARQKRTLLGAIQNPPEGLPWTRADKLTFLSLLEKLGGELPKEDDDEDS